MLRCYLFTISKLRTADRVSVILSVVYRTTGAMMSSMYAYLAIISLAVLAATPGKSFSI